ncbi:MAG TPA: SpaA isopeptide-forming pilin-related protein [Acidimicrobiales bacterium]|nr:SpaA isopeptide-forming pilin-related protein [Acidimicrobiales bacterium]
MLCHPHDDISAGVIANGGEGDNLCGTITVTKTDSWTGKALAGATFTLYWGPCDKNGKPVGPAVDSPSTLTNPVTTDSTGTATFSPVYFQWWGGKEYCVVETGVPAGYTGAAAGQTVTVYGHYHTYVNDKRTETCTAPTKDDGDHSATADNGETLPNICVTAASFKNDPIPVTLTVHKYGSTPTGNVPLSGAGFTLEQGGAAASANVNGSPSCVTDGTGTCTISNIEVAGSYSLVETAPPGATWTVAPPTPLTIVLGENQVATVVDAAVTVTTAPSTAASGGATTAAVTGATTVHTGEAFAGSRPYVLGALALGGSLLGLGLVRRRNLRKVDA